ncbi:MAG TPA: ABC transporter substrate-binding protein [Methylomirabilota bacterium]|nr:ABC transporter substrate-binding protein [Methylomirabilota bacterium]
MARSPCHTIASGDNCLYDGRVPALLAVGLLLLAATPAPAQTFTFAWPTEPVQLDPAVVSDGPSLGLTYQVFEGLVRLRGSTTEIEPALAERWETSADGMVWTFHLRPNVRFHDGDPLDAAAVVWNVERWWKSSHPQHAIQLQAGQTFEYWDSLFGGPDERAVVSRVEAAGPRAVRITLRRPHAPLLASLAVPGLGIASPRAATRWGAEFGKHPVGTGAFRFGAWRPGEEVVLEANPDYWGARPKVARVVGRAIKDNAKRLAALRAGDIQGMEGLNPDDLEGVGREPTLSLLLRPPSTTGFVAFNFKVREFQDRRVRRAFAHALDKPAIVNALYGGMGLVARQLQPPALWGHAPDIPDDARDPATARDLLRQAGFPNGLDTLTWDDGRKEPLVLWYLPVSRPYFPVPRDIAQAMAADWAKAGIRVRLQTVDWAVYLERVQHGRLPLFMLGWIADHGDPDGCLCYVFCEPGAPNQGFYANRAVTELLVRARTLSSQAQRAPLYRRAAELLHEDAARLFLAHSQSPIVLSRRVTGYVPNPTGAEAFSTVELR